MRYEPSPQTLSWFRDRYLEGTLQIKPPFQRNPVWALRQKCSLVETILMGLPVPEIYVQVTVTEEGDTTYAVVDGQQRIRAALQFLGVDKDPNEAEYNRFVLDRLSEDSEWKDCSFEELRAETRKEFFRYQFAVRLLHTEDDTEIRDMFRRLNEFLTPLNAQEIRNARFTGPFIRTATRLADHTYWAEVRMFTPAQIRRMTDVQFVSELLIGVMHGPQGGSSKIVNEYYKIYEDYEDEFPNQTRVLDLFRRTLATIQKVLPEIRKTRWSNRTDFYTLFVSMAHLLRSGLLRRDSTTKLRRELLLFGQAIDTRLADEEKKVPALAIDYVRAVEKGANDKLRRAARHKCLLGQITGHFTGAQ